MARRLSDLFAQPPHVRVDGDPAVGCELLQRLLRGAPGGETFARQAAEQVVVIDAVTRRPVVGDQRGPDRRVVRQVPQLTEEVCPRLRDGHVGEEIALVRRRRFLG